MIHLEVAIENVDELLNAQAYGAGALLRWESAATVGGTYNEGGTLALVSGTTIYDVWDSAGDIGTWYRTRVSDAAGTTFSSYSAVRQATASAASLVLPEQVMALVQSNLTSDQVQDIIYREEAFLARQITALSGSRTQAYYIGDPAARGLWWDVISMSWPQGRSPWATLWMASDRMGPLGLLRPTSSVTVVDNGVTIADSDIRLLRQGTLVERASGGWNGPLVEITYTPDDELEVVRVVIELCRLTMTDTGFQEEQIGDYRYVKNVRSAITVDPRKALIRSLMTHLPKGTMRIRTSVEDDRIGAIS